MRWSPTSRTGLKSRRTAGNARTITGRKRRPWQRSGGASRRNGRLCAIGIAPDGRLVGGYTIAFKGARKPSPVETHAIEELARAAAQNLARLGA